MTEKDKLKAFLKEKGISKNKFYTRTGFSVGFLDSGRSLGADKVGIIIREFPDLNLWWLITGEGPMLVEPGTQEGVVYEMAERVSKVAEPEAPYYASPKIYTSADFAGTPAEAKVPLYDFDAAVGLAPVFEGRTKPTGYLSIPDLPRCDGAVKMRGDAMYPLLKAGDMVLYKQVRDCTNIIWGEMYLLSFVYDDEVYTTVKYVNQVEDRPDFARLVSCNQHHAPMDLPLSAIRALAIVKVSIRFNTMG